MATFPTENIFWSCIGPGKFSNKLCTLLTVVSGCIEVLLDGLILMALKRDTDIWIIHMDD